jgi:hypothetical protein
MTYDGDDFAETKDFQLAYSRIGWLLKTLQREGRCGCCIARSLLYHGAGLHEWTMGSVATAEMLEGIAAALRKNNLPAPDCGATH